MAVITLLTDFGLNDAYVGIMKGVILSKAPEARIVDISHGILPQHLIQAAYRIESAYSYFPKGSVHTIVVDPGVGSQRAIIAIETAGFYFLAPDNGVLTPVLEREAVSKAVRVENRSFFLEPVSRTFHGRDIFAPVAAHLALGGNIDRLGSCISPAMIHRLDMPRPVLSETGELTGTIIDIDRFGNLITNITEERLGTGNTDTHPKISLLIGKTTISGPSSSYSNIPPGRPLCIIGSRGHLEIAVNCGSAKDYFSAAIGEQVTGHVTYSL